MAIALDRLTGVFSKGRPVKHRAAGGWAIVRGGCNARYQRMVVPVSRAPGIS
jgi:hypothetical protein